MRHKKLLIVSLMSLSVFGLTQCVKDIKYFKDNGHQPPQPPKSIVSEGKNIFRFDTFGRFAPPWCAGIRLLTQV